MIRDYNGFRHEQKIRVSAWLRYLAEHGLRAAPRSCHACGQIRGAIGPHLEDLREPFGKHNREFHLCWLCKAMLHCRFNEVLAWDAYRGAVRVGAQWDPRWHKNSPDLFANNFLGMSAAKWPKPLMAKQATALLDEFDRAEHAPEVAFMWLQPRIKAMNEERADNRLPTTNPSVPQVWRAPWTEQQVRALQERQHDYALHDYTCRCGLSLRPKADGWHCSCTDGVVQTWALECDLNRELTWPF